MNTALDIDPENGTLLLDMPYEIARDNAIILKSKRDGCFQVIITPQTDIGALISLRESLTLPFDVQLTDVSSFQTLCNDHYGRGPAEIENVAALDKGSAPFLPATMATHFLEKLIKQASHLSVYDIHFEAEPDNLNVQLRLSGVLLDWLRLPSVIGAEIIAYIRHLVNAALSNRASLRDGYFVIEAGSALPELQISILKCTKGSSVTVHIVNDLKKANNIGLPGLSQDADAIISQTLSGFGGIIIVTGLAGSGRMETLYALLNYIKQREKLKMLTVENSILRALDGVRQTELRTSEKDSFARGLKAALMQNPDVVMLGAINDKQTAEIAAKAATKGKLILSSVDKPDALSAISYLRGLKVEPFLLASALRAVIAQRIARRLCQKCKEPIQSDGSTASLLGFDKGTIVFTAKGCKQCGHSGYDGQIGVFEVIVVDDILRPLLNSNSDPSLLSRYAFSNHPNLNAAARRLVRSGDITPDEAISLSRAVYPDPS